MFQETISAHLHYDSTYQTDPMAIQMLDNANNMELDGQKLADDIMTAFYALEVIRYPIWETLQRIKEDMTSYYFQEDIERLEYTWYQVERCKEMIEHANAFGARRGEHADKMKTIAKLIADIGNDLVADFNLKLKEAEDNVKNAQKQTH